MRDIFDDRTWSGELAAMPMQIGDATIPDGTHVMKERDGTSVCRQRNEAEALEEWGDGIPSPFTPEAEIWI